MSQDRELKSKKDLKKYPTINIIPFEDIQGNDNSTISNHISAIEENPSSPNKITNHNEKAAFLEVLSTDLDTPKNNCNCNCNCTPSLDTQIPSAIPSFGCHSQKNLNKSQHNSSSSAHSIYSNSTSPNCSLYPTSDSGNSLESKCHSQTNSIFTLDSLSSSKVRKKANNKIFRRSSTYATSASGVARKAIPFKKNNLEALPLKGNSFFLFSPENRFRKWVSYCVRHKRFCQTINFLIFMDWLLMVSSIYEKDGDVIKAKISFLYGLDLALFRPIFNWIFLLELVFKMIAYGVFDKSLVTIFILRRNSSLKTESTNSDSTETEVTPSVAFFGQFLNVFDFTSVAAFWINHIYNLFFLKHLFFLRALSAIRPLRLLNVVPLLSSYVKALRKSLSLLGNVAFFLAYFFLLFGILGMVLFKGGGEGTCVSKDPAQTFWPKTYCRIKHTQHYHDKVNSNLQDKRFIPRPQFACPLEFNCEIDSLSGADTLNFGNIFASTLSVYVVSSVENWTNIMYRIIISHSEWAAIFFIFCVILLNYWLVTLFVTVIARMFEKLREDCEIPSIIKSKKSTKISHSISFSYDTKANKMIDVIKSTKVYLANVFGRTILFLQFVYPLLDKVAFTLITIDLVIIINYYNLQSPFYSIRRTINGLLLVESFLQLFRFLQETKKYRPESSKALAKFWKDFGVLVHFFLCLVTFILCFVESEFDGKAFKFFPIFRVCRLALAVPTTRALALTLATKLPDIFSLLWFIVICILLVAPISMQLIGGHIPSEIDDEFVFMRFNSFKKTIFPLFQIFTGEDWPEILLLASSQAGDNQEFYISVVIFIVLWSAFSNFILLNLFIAVTTEAFETAENRKHRCQFTSYVNSVTRAWARKRENPYSVWNIYRYFKARPLLIYINNIPDSLVASIPLHMINGLLSGTGTSEKIETSKASSFWWLSAPSQKPLDDHFSLQHVIDRFAFNLNTIESHQGSGNLATERDYYKAEFYYSHPLYNTAWLLFDVKHPMRQLCCSLTDPVNDSSKPSWKTANFWFNMTVFLSVLFAVAATLINSPSHRHNIAMHWVSPLIRKVDYVLAGFFLMEFLIRTIAHGFLFTPNAYLKNIWYQIDFIVMIMLFMDILIPLESSLRISRVMGAFKALRAFRLISIIPGARNTFYGVFVKGFPQILNVSLLLLAFVLPYALFGHTLFKDMASSCNDSSIFEHSRCLGFFVHPSTKILVPRAWDNFVFYSFDSVGSSLLVLAEVLSGEGWVKVAAHFMTFGSSGSNIKINWWAGVYFVVFYIIGTIMVLSTFVSITIENHRLYTGISYLTANQRRWIDLKKQLSQSFPSFHPHGKERNHPFKSWCYNIVTKKTGVWPNVLAVAHFVLLLVILVDFKELDEQIQYIKSCASFLVLGLILVDPILRLIGLGWHAYRGSMWALAHAIITTLAFLMTSLSMLFHWRETEICSRVLCLFVTMKLILKSNRLSEFSMIAVASFPDILNMLLAWLVLYLTYAIFFNQAFGLTRLGTYGSNLVNFQGFPNTFLLLFRMTTGEGWNDIMHDYMIEEPYCVYDPENFITDCGNLILAYILFLTFNIFSTFIFTNMFIVILMDNFNYCYEIAASFPLLSRMDLRGFKRSWSTFDQHGSGYIPRKDLVDFLFSLKPPFQIRFFESCFSIGALQNTWKTIRALDHTRRVSDDDHIAYFMWLDEKLMPLSRRRAIRRKREFNILYHHILSLEEPGRGIPYSRVLVLLTQYKIVKPDQCLTISDLISFRHKRQQVLTVYYQEKFVGLCQTWILRKKFLQHCQNRKIPSLLSVIVGCSNNPITSSSVSAKSTRSRKESSVVPSRPVCSTPNSLRLSSQSGQYPNDLDVDEELAHDILLRLTSSPWSSLLQNDQ